MLHLSSRWGFVSLRKLALKAINPPTPFDQLLLARAYSVDHWVLPALSALCERTVPLSLNEASQMRIEDVVLISTVREDIRPHELQVDPDEIPHCIEAVQAGMRAIATGQGALHLHGAKGGVTPTSLASSPSATSNGTERSARSTAALANSSGAEGENEDDAETAVALSPVEVRRGVKREDDEGQSGWGGGVGSFVSRSTEEKSSRPTSAWGKILVVPSPTISLPPPVPEWDDPPSDPEPPSWGFGRAKSSVKSVRRANPVPPPPMFVGDDVEDSDGEVDWARTKPAFCATIT